MKATGSVTTRHTQLALSWLIITDHTFSQTLTCIRYFFLRVFSYLSFFIISVFSQALLRYVFSRGPIIDALRPVLFAPLPQSPHRAASTPSHTNLCHRPQRSANTHCIPSNVFLAQSWSTLPRVNTLWSYIKNLCEVDSIIFSYKKSWTF